MIPLAYGAWLGFVALQRLVELGVSRRNLRRIARDPEASAARAAEGPRAWAAMVALHASLLVLPPIEIVLCDRRPPSWLAWSAFAVFVLAQALRAWTLATLGRAWNARGVVAPSIPIVTRGPYRFVRHPNYLAVVLEVLSIPLGGGAYGSLGLLTVLLVPVLARRIRGEEALLARVPGWTAWFADKGRLLPRA